MAIGKSDALCVDIQRVFEEHLEVFDAHKIWRQLNREEIPVARYTIERRTRLLGTG